MKELALKVKRIIDLIAAAGLLVLFAPLIAALSLAVRLSMGRPVFFRQARLGYQGREFQLIKFRTMTEEYGPDGALLPDGQRMTRFGAFLRSTSLDELPELINVIKGDMSLVGPRPLLVEYRDLYTPEQWRRHEMPPGMAGPVIAEGRNTLSWEEKFQKDIDYIDNWSLGLDIKILIKTILKVINREGTSADNHATMPRFEGDKHRGG